MKRVDTIGKKEKERQIEIYVAADTVLLREKQQAAFDMYRFLIDQYRTDFSIEDFSKYAWDRIILAWKNPNDTEWTYVFPAYRFHTYRMWQKIVDMECADD